MSEPAGPTGVITLKKIADMTYEQYGSIVLSQTGITQVTASASTLDTVFQPDIEQRMTWIEDFGSRIQHNEVVAANRAAWQSGVWGSQGGINEAFKATALLDGAGRMFLQTISTALPDMKTVSAETPGGIQTDPTRPTSHPNRNPIFYMRWAQTATDSGGTFGIGWHRGGESFVNLELTPSGLLGGIYFRHAMNGDIWGACRTHVGFTQTETTISMGVSASAGVYHTGRIVITGGGAAAEFFVDGVSKGSITTNIPMDDGEFALQPGFSNSNANVPVCDVDYMALSQQRTP